MVDNLIKLTENQVELFKREKVFIETNKLRLEDDNNTFRFYEPEEVYDFLQSTGADDYGKCLTLLVEFNPRINWSEDDADKLHAFWGDKESLNGDSDEYKSAIEFLNSKIREEFPKEFDGVILTEGVEFDGAHEYSWKPIINNKLSIRITEWYKIKV